MIRSLLLSVAVGLLAGGVSAQIAKGSPAPAFTIEKGWNDAPTSFDDLAGKVVILDFAQTWWGPCKAAVPHLNELHEKFAARGLLLIGVSDEAEGLIEETFLTKLGAKYPFIKVKGINEQYGIKFFPSVYTIDTNGNVHSVPDDRMPSESTIEELLKTVSLAPKLPEGAQFDPLRQMWNKKDYLKVQEYLGKMLAAPNLAADLKEVFEAQQQALQKKVEQQQKRVATLAEGPDYYTAKEQLEKVQKEWKGLPPAEDATKALATFAADADIKKEIAAGKAFAALLAKYDRSKISQARKLQEELPKFAKKYEHTYAGQQAAKMAESK